MTIWFSTNIPEMRAISVFNRVSKDIGDIQQRIATGQRINSGKDDPGGLIIREGLRADIKGIHATQANMGRAESFTESASNGLMALLEILVGSDPSNKEDSGLIGAMLSAETPVEAQEAAEAFMKLYDAAVKTTTYNGESLIGTRGGLERTYQLGGGETLKVEVSDWSTAAESAVGEGDAGRAAYLAEEIEMISTHGTTDFAVAAARVLQGEIAAEVGSIGTAQKIVAQNQRLLDSRLTNTVAAEGRISNVDLGVESSRLARAELLAQNSMNSIMYNRSYAAFSVLSLFG